MYKKLIAYMVLTALSVPIWGAARSKAVQSKVAFHKAKLSARAKQSDPDRFFSLPGLIDAGLCPADSKSRKEFLSGLKNALDVQKELMGYIRLGTGYSRLVIDMKERNVALFARCASDEHGKIMFTQQLDDPAEVAFLLRYAPLLTTDIDLGSHNPERYNEIIAMREAGRSLANAELQNVLELFEALYKMPRMAEYLDNHIWMPFVKLTERLVEIGEKNRSLDNLYDIDKPLHSTLAIYKKIAAMNHNVKDGRELSKEQQLEVIKEDTALCDFYQTKAPLLDKLSASIDRVLNPVPDDFLTSLDKPSSGVKGKRNKGSNKSQSSVQRTKRVPEKDATKIAVASSSTSAAADCRPRLYTPEELIQLDIMRLTPSIQYSSLSHADGSRTVMENDRLVEIHDEPNKARIHLFKLHAPHGVPHPELRYIPWVRRWFEDPQAAMEEQGYNDPSSSRGKYGTDPRETIVRHCITRLVDAYIPSCGVLSTMENRRHQRIDRVITMPAFINGAPHLMRYFFDSSKNECCYHRNAERCPAERLLNEYQTQGYYTVDVADDAVGLD